MHAPLVRHWIAAPLVSFGLLGGLWVERQLLHLPSGDEGAYHARVRLAADQLPYRVGEWVGVDVEVPPSATALLRPNALLGRRFSNASTREHVTVTIAQCEDARDMRGHYPPVCYPCQGWTQREDTQVELATDWISVPVTVYRFTKESIHEYSEILVYNFFVLPNGAIERDQAGLRRAAEDPRTRRYGAAQIQITFGPSMSADRRAQVFRMMIELIRPLIDTIRRGDAR